MYIIVNSLQGLYDSVGAPNNIYDLHFEVKPWKTASKNGKMQKEMFLAVVPVLIFRRNLKLFTALTNNKNVFMQSRLILK